MKKTKGSSTMSDLVKYASVDGICSITLNRPSKLNAINTEMDKQLVSALARFDEDADSYVAILSGAGRSFSAGADIKDRFIDTSGTNDRRLRQGRPAEGFLGKCSYWKPVISAVHGHCLGLGFHLALESDLIVAGSDAVFGAPEVKRGLSAGAHWALMGAFMPSKLATELLITGKEMSARDLYRRGLVNEVTDRGAHFECATRLAAHIRDLPQRAVRSSVRLTRWAWPRKVAEAQFFTAALRLDDTEEFRDANSAFYAARGKA